ncbi:kelch-like protein 24a [Saccoglossus kowalevskii]|uniref:Kelch-like protein 24-like n=1 Tax=Saccoglossus kowalevskii TaxID=10224 RepID=A0ABM0GWG1_SACKO|nr:PREDICTED: kelch-like protein 24-like [Saccoglossus kowalevskii]
MTTEIKSPYVNRGDEYHHLSHAKKSLRIINELRNENWNTDVTLSAGDEYFRCHGVVLAAASLYLYDLIEQDREDVTSAREVVITDLDMLGTIVDYIYTGHVCIGAQYVKALRKTSKLLKLKTLETVCEAFRDTIKYGREFKFDDEAHAQFLHLHLNILREESCLTDVTFRVGDHVIQCHKTVLSASSSYFKAMFTHEMLENELDHITIKETDPYIFDSLVRFSYTGKVTITNENVQNLVLAADRLNFTEVVDLCVHYMQQNLHSSNCLGVWEFAQVISHDTLSQTAWQFAVKNFSAVSEHEEFLCLASDKLETLMSAPLFVLREEDVYESLMRWYHESEADRRAHLPRLLQHIRYPFMAPEYLQQIERELKDIVDTQMYMEEADDYRHMKYKERLKHHFNLRMTSRVYIHVIIVVTSSGPILVFDPEDNRWFDLTIFPLVSREQIITASILGNDVLCTTNAGHSWVYSIPGNEWTRRAPPLHMHERNVGHKSASIAGRVFIPGVARRCQTMEVYNPGNDKWSEAPSMPKAVCYHALTSCNGNLFVIGGMGNGGAITKAVQMYDVDENVWSLRAEIPVKCAHAAAAATESKIYVFGNQDECMDSVFQYDVIANVWSDVATLNAGRQRCTGVTCNGKVYAIGGLREPLWKGVVDVVEVYDTGLNKWSVVSHLPYHVFVQASIAVPKYAIPRFS